MYKLFFIRIIKVMFFNDIKEHSLCLFLTGSGGGSLSSISVELRTLLPLL